MKTKKKKKLPNSKKEQRNYKIYEKSQTRPQEKLLWRKAIHREAEMEEQNGSRGTKNGKGK